MTDSPEEQPADLDDPQWVDKILARARERAAAAVDAPPVIADSAPAPPATSAPAAPTAPPRGSAPAADPPARPPAARRRPEPGAGGPDGAPRRPRTQPTPGAPTPAPTPGPATLDRGGDAAPTASPRRPRPTGPRPASTVLSGEGALEDGMPRWGAANARAQVPAAAEGVATGPAAQSTAGVDAAADATVATAEPHRAGTPDGLDPAGDDSTDDSTDDGTDDASRRRLRNGVEWVAVAVGAVVVALVIRAFVLQAFYIPSESMVPTLKENDRILVNKVSYRLHDVNRGDLVVFHKPPNEPPGEASDLIKRVIGLSGETLELRGNDIYIDGRRLTEPYLTSDIVTSNLGWVAGCANAQSERTQCTVPPGHVFVMGDNRTRSHDSRFFGPISEELIVGRAFVRVWPLGELGFL